MKRFAIPTRRKVPAKKNRVYRLQFAAIAGTLACAPFAGAADFVVTTDADVVDPDDGQISLREAVKLANLAPGVDTISFSNGAGGGVDFHDDNPETITLALGEIDVCGPVTIIGPGAEKLSISGGDASRIFDIADDDNTITGLTIRNGMGVGGGAIFKDGGTLIMTDCVVKDSNSVGDSGGGIYVEAGGLELTDTTVSGNIASEGGGGIVAVTSTLILVRSIVEKNTGQGFSGGGIHAADSNVSLTDTVVSENIATGDEAIYVSGGSRSLIRSTVDKNDGCGISTQFADVSLTDSFVRENIGCGISSTGDVGTNSIALTGCTVENNGEGGIAANTMELSVTDCVCSGNDGTESGGGIFAASSSVTITRSSLEMNESFDNGGGIYAEDTTLTVLDCTVSGNTTSDQGGGIHGTRCVMEIRGSAVRANNATGGLGDTGNGGGINAIDTDLTLENCAVVGNNAFENGGGLFAQRCAMEVLRSTVSANTVMGTFGGNGGGICFVDGTGSLSLSACTISGNTGIDGGAGVHSSGDNNVELTQCTVSGNIANSPESTGGGVYANRGSVSLIHCTLSGNRANSGGGMYTEAVDLTLANCILANSTGLDIDLDGTALTLSGINIVQQGIIRAMSDGTGQIISDPAHLLTIDPLLAPLRSNGGPTKTHGLFPESPAIDGGDNAFASALANDQRGSRFPRVVGGVVDIGAFEFSASDAPRGILDDVPCLSLAAKNSLVAHFDGRTNVVPSEAGSVVQSWTPVDGAGRPLPAMALGSTGNGEPFMITYDGSGTLKFEDTPANRTRYLSGVLANTGGSEMTVIWFGRFDAGSPVARFGAYAFNIGLNQLSHQRDDLGGGFTVEMYNGTTYPGTVDISPLDGIDTVWTTTVTADSHRAFAGATDLDIQGDPSYAIQPNADIVIGAFDSSGYDLLGEMKQLVIFESALDEIDRMILQEYFEGELVPVIPPPPAVSEIDGLIEITWSGHNVALQKSSDLIEWETLLEAVSPLSLSPSPGGTEYDRLICGVDGL